MLTIRDNTPPPGEPRPRVHAPAGGGHEGGLAPRLREPALLRVHDHRHQRDRQRHRRGQRGRQQVLLALFNWKLKVQMFRK